MTGRGASLSCCPGSFPNLLANGATGIAVGMATSIPPHNVGEICEALLLLIDNPEIAMAKLVKKNAQALIFRPAASSSSLKDSILQAYTTGRGGFTPARALEKGDARAGDVADRDQ